MTPEEQKKLREEKDKRVQDAKAFADYKKRLKENVEVKRLQAEELELNVRFYEAKEAWIEMQGRISQIEEKEAQLIAREQEEARKRRDEMIKTVEEQKKAEEAAKDEEVKEKTEEKPKKITPVKQGKPRK